MPQKQSGACPTHTVHIHIFDAAVRDIWVDVKVTVVPWGQAATPAIRQAENNKTSNPWPWAHNSSGCMCMKGPDLLW